MPVAHSDSAPDASRLPQREGKQPGESAAPGFSGRALLLFFLALFFALFPGVWTGARTFFYRDFGVLGYPTLFLARQAFRAGHWPLWNYYSNCGAPFLAQWGTMCLYPGTLFYCLLPMPWAANVFCLAHLIWGALGARALARRWGRSEFAASAAGAAFILNGITLSSLIWPNYTVALGWMPWVVWSLEKSWAAPRTRFLAAAILSSTCQLSAGAPELSGLTWLLAAVLGARRAAAQPREFRRVLGVAGLVALSTVGLLAAQLAPFLELASHSQRSFSFATSKWAMPASGWANLFVPLFRAFHTPQGIYFQFGQEFLSSTYLGVILMALAAAEVLCWDDSRSGVLFALALLAVAIAMGDSGALYPALRRMFPFLGLARYPIKWLFLTNLIVPLLAGGFLHRWAAGATGKREWRALLISFGIALACISGILAWDRFRPARFEPPGVVFENGLLRAGFLSAAAAWLAVYPRIRARRARQAAHWFFLALITGDVLTHTPCQNPTLPAEALRPDLWQRTMKSPPPAVGQGRIFITPYAERHLLLSLVPDFESDFIGKRLAEWSNLNLLDAIPKVNGSATLQIREQKEIQDWLYGTNHGDWRGLKDFLAVTEQTAPRKILDWEPRASALPWITAGQRPFYGPAAKSALSDPGFDPRKTAWLPAEAQRFLATATAAAAATRAQHFDWNRIEAEVWLEQDGLAVVAQSSYPAWRAYVDGRAAPIFRANGAFQAIPIPRGRHHLELRYEDRAFFWGGAASLFTLAALASAAFFRGWGRRVAA